MIVLWLCLLVAAGALARYGARLSAQAAPLTWPTEAPLNAHDNRSHDPRLARLTRLLRAGPTSEAHAELRDATDALLAGGRAHLSPEVLRFLEQPPIADPERYRRELVKVLDRIESGLGAP
ncbi:hypothetical protein GCM10028801_42580 [Nocardioides maradonensis]